MRRPLLLAAALALNACDSAPRVAVRDAVVAAGPDSAAVYGIVANDGGSGDRLVGIEVDGRVPISLHQTSNDGGVMRMRSVAALDVPAGGQLELKSGGAHGMAMGRIEAPGGRLPLTFRFEKAGAVKVDARVTGPGGMEHRR
ncbi:copper chaperone PCu(A)C [Sphingomonas mesophila]|uniref:copper chaperone PCu(A)C n=1 Tax=Sphingomonas mesophila TaxID=2303576 RepID=UPI000E57B482|nr:copper chaperone PCu(A)C [Sphingomonas mesophila]